MTPICYCREDSACETRSSLHHSITTGSISRKIFCADLGVEFGTDSSDKKNTNEFVDRKVLRNFARKIYNSQQGSLATLCCMFLVIVHILPDGSVSMFILLDVNFRWFIFNMVSLSIVSLLPLIEGSIQIFWELNLHWSVLESIGYACS